MRVKIVFYLFLSLIVDTSYSQTSHVKWISDHYELSPKAFCLDSLGNYVTATDLPSGYGTGVLCLSPNGDTVWSQELINFHRISDLKPDGDEIVFVGSGYPGGQSIGRFDLEGNVVWYKTMYTHIPNHIQSFPPYFNHVYLAEDGGYVIDGIVFTNSLDSNHYGGLWKLDSDGEVEWCKTYVADDNNYLGWHREVKYHENLGYIYICPTATNFGIRIVRFSEEGDVIWNRTYANWNLNPNLDYDFYSGGFEISEDGFIYISGGGSFSISNGSSFIAKLDSNGNKVWANVYNNNGSLPGYFNTLDQLNDSLFFTLTQIIDSNGITRGAYCKFDTNGEIVSAKYINAEEPSTPRLSYFTDTLIHILADGLSANLNTYFATIYSMSLDGVIECDTNLFVDFEFNHFDTMQFTPWSPVGIVALDSFTNSITTLQTVAYPVEIVDHCNGCFTSDIQSLPELCYGDSNGSIEVIAPTGGNLTYTLNAGIPQLSSSFQSLTKGMYSVGVIDSASCQSNYMVDVFGPDTLLYLNSSETDVECFGFDNGQIQVTPLGGTQGYSYGWSTGDSTLHLTNLQAGQYGFTLIDSFGCVVQDSFQINEPDSLTISFTYDTACYNNYNGEATAFPSGGISPYSYYWGPGISNSFPSRGYLYGDDTYAITVTDDNGCVAIDSVYVPENPEIYWMLDSSLLVVECNDDSTGYILGHATGGTPGYNYFWSNGQQGNELDSLSAGNYYLTIADSRYCPKYVSYSIQEPTVLSGSLTSVDLLCYGDSNGSALSQVAGGTPGYSFAWSTGDTTSSILNLHVGNYSLTVTDVHDCSMVLSTTLEQPDSLYFSSMSQDSCKCYGDSTGVYSAAVTGGISPYSLLLNGQLVSNPAGGLSAGLYQAKMVDANGCEVSDSIEILQPEPLSYSNTNENLLCYLDSNAQISLLPFGGVGGYEINWFDEDSNATKNNLPAGTFSFTIQDGNNCEITDSIQLTEPDSINLTIDSLMNELWGLDGKAYVSVSGGVGGWTYDWSNDSVGDFDDAQDQLNLASGWYNIEVKDTNGCIAKDSVFIDSSLGLEVKNESDISIFPNPATSMFSFSKVVNEIERILIFNSSGALVYTNAEPSDTPVIKVDDWPVGNYLVVLRQLGKIQALPLIVIK